MAADKHRAVLHNARGRIPAVWQDATELGTFTHRRIERIIAIAAGIGSLMLGAYAFVASLGSASDELPEWRLPVMIIIFGTLGAMIVACFFGRAVRITASIFAVVYVVVLVLWPIATAGSTPVPDVQPWIWILLNIATLAAVLAFPVLLQMIWTIGAPLVFGAMRIIQAGFDPEFWWPLGLDVSFPILLGGVIFTLGWTFRAMANDVDRSRARAVAAYAAAAASDAAEQERVAVAALMHDSVLAALIAAERATSSREQTLAVAMAREALTRLANAEQDVSEGSDEARSAADIARAFERASVEMGVRQGVTTMITEDAVPVPGRVARALVLAATQALANSLQHAGGHGLGLRLMADRDRTLIEVSDRGGGFDLDDVPEDRLGIRGSIFARVAAVRGEATIDSSPRGTTVTLEWRAP